MRLVNPMTARPLVLSADSVLFKPRIWHAISLIVSVILLAVAARHLWFFSDEWDFLIPSNDAKIFAPHVGHWSTTPILMTQALRDVFGIDAYWPFIALSMAVHLLLCHMLWRIMLRVGVNAWIATALAALMMLLGAGAENILWAFQVGFMGAVLIGLIVVFLVDVEVMSRRRWVAVELLAIWSLTFSGTALPVLLAAAVVSWNRRGIWRTVVQFGTVLAVYGVWFLSSAVGHVVSYGPTSLQELIYGVPSYIGHEFADGLGSVFRSTWLGVVLVVCLVTWIGLSIFRWRNKATVAYALAVAAVAQATLTALTRVHIGLDTAASGRYVYVLVALLLTIIGLALTWVAHNRRLLTALIAVLVLILTGENTLVLSEQAVHYAEIEQSSKARISAALSLVFRDHVRVGAALIPSPDFAGELDMANLEAIYRHGWIHIGTFDEPARLSVLARLRVVVQNGNAPLSQRGCIGVATEKQASFSQSVRKIDIYSSKPTLGSVNVTNGTSAGDDRTITVPAGWTRIVTTAGAKLNLRLASPSTMCTG